MAKLHKHVLSVIVGNVPKCPKWAQAHMLPPRYKGGKGARVIGYRAQFNVPYWFVNYGGYAPAFVSQVTVQAIQYNAWVGHKLYAAMALVPIGASKGFWANAHNALFTTKAAALAACAATQAYKVQCGHKYGYAHKLQP